MRIFPILHYQTNFSMPAHIYLFPAWIVNQIFFCLVMATVPMKFSLCWKLIYIFLHAFFLFLIRSIAFQIIGGCGWIFGIERRQLFSPRLLSSSLWIQLNIISHQFLKIWWTQPRLLRIFLIFWGWSTVFVHNNCLYNNYINFNKL